MFTVQMALIDDVTWEARIDLALGVAAVGRSDNPDRAIQRATGEAQRLVNLMGATERRVAAPERRLTLGDF